MEECVRKGGKEGSELRSYTLHTAQIHQKGVYCVLQHLQPRIVEWL